MDTSKDRSEESHPSELSSSAEGMTLQKLVGTDTNAPKLSVSIVSPKT